MILIFVHEIGHLISAKLTGIRVNEFALGMGPKIFGFDKGETRYTLRAIPLGGFCALEGDDEDSEDPRAFNNRPARFRALLLFAGSLMNVLLAIVLISLIIFSLGFPTRVIATVHEEMPAYSDGLRAGDEIVMINGTPVAGWGEISPLLKAAAKADENSDPLLIITVKRDGSEHTIRTHFYKDEDGSLILGISPKPGWSLAYFFKSFGYGVRQTVEMCKMMYDVLGQLFTGKVGVDQIMGPVGIAVIVGDTVKYGFTNLAYLTALISLNLGIINLLPFPALDGGRLIFLLIRKITGKKITNEIEGRVHLVGILVLFGFMALITMQDINRFFIN